MFAWPALANDKLIELEKDANQWVSPTQNYANTRFSTLDQINKSNVKNLQVAWTFSTGVLRGHEGSPLVVGETMYRAYAVPEHRLRARPERRRRDQVEVRAGSGSERHSRHVLRYGQPRRRLRSGG